MNNWQGATNNSAQDDMSGRFSDIAERENSAPWPAWWKRQRAQIAPFDEPLHKAELSRRQTRSYQPAMEIVAGPYGVSYCSDCANVYANQPHLRQSTGTKHILRVDLICPNLLFACFKRWGHKSLIAKNSCLPHQSNRDRLSVPLVRAKFHIVCPG